MSEPFAKAQALIRRQLQAGNARVQIGVIGKYGAANRGDLDDPNATVLDIAYLAEFGLDRPDRPQVPARKPLRLTFNRESPRWSKVWSATVSAYVREGGTQRQRLVALGALGFNAVRTTYSAGMKPELSEMAKRMRRHGGETPFVDTGQTMRSNLAEITGFDGQIIVVGQERG